MATEKIEEYIRKHNLGERIYHYCGLHALKGIVCNAELWLRSTSKMNDRKESLFYIEQMYERLAASSHPDDVMTYQELFAEMTANMPMYFPFAMCFSREEDNAAQWERYADNARGFCIEFDTAKLIETLDGTGVMIALVNYGEIEWGSHPLYAVIKEYVRNEPYYSETRLKEQVISDIIVNASAYKHRSFKTEAETRIVRFGTAEEDGIRVECVSVGDVIDTITKVDLLKLAELKGINLGELITKVVAGPRNSSTKEEIYQYLVNESKKPYIGNVICESECPLR